MRRVRDVETFTDENGVVRTGYKRQRRVPAWGIIILTFGVTACATIATESLFDLHDIRASINVDRAKLILHLPSQEAGRPGAVMVLADTAVDCVRELQQAASKSDDAAAQARVYLDRIREEVQK